MDPTRVQLCVGPAPLWASRPYGPSRSTQLSQDVRFLAQNALVTIWRLDLQRSPNPLAGFKGGPLEGGKWEGRE